MHATYRIIYFNYSILHIIILYNVIRASLLSRGPTCIRRQAGSGHSGVPPAFRGTQAGPLFGDSLPAPLLPLTRVCLIKQEHTSKPSYTQAASTKSAPVLPAYARRQAVESALFVLSVRPFVHSSVRPFVHSSALSVLSALSALSVESALSALSVLSLVCSSVRLFFF